MRVRWTAMAVSVRSRGFRRSVTLPVSPNITAVDVIRVPGGARLAGGGAVAGAENSALKLMAVALLAPGVTVLDNVPRITDILIMAEVLRRLGCDVTLEDTPAAEGVGHPCAVRLDGPERVGPR